MSTTTTDNRWLELLRTLLLGALLAVGIGLAAGEPEHSWLGFALAAIITEAGRARPCLPRVPGRSRK